MSKRYPFGFWLFLPIFALIQLNFSQTDEFLADQKRYPRVRKAIELKAKTLEEDLEKLDLNSDNFHLLMLAYKEEGRLKLYAKSPEEGQYRFLKAYDICRKSGNLGPKRKSGDRQVPEGFYHIDRFNPASQFLLSLGLNYPNTADRIKSDADNLGGDIFIHGSCVTVGCLPMTNDKIREIYLYASYAKNNGQAKIPVYIFPFEMSNLKHWTAKIKQFNDSDLIDFWENLKQGHDLFVQNRRPLQFRVNASGDYVFNGAK